MQNQLADSSSPYLAMHGKDPVKWQYWNEQAVQQARQENKLLFVSIGYFSCHWCHVMQRESYQNSTIAGLLNKHFIPVKVDRELHPALDAALIKFVERTRGYSGWPLNVFITPQGHPLIGIVYLPPADFQSLIENLATTWQQEQDKLKTMAREAAAEMQPPLQAATAELDKDLGQRYQNGLLAMAMKMADDTSGGFGDQSKFPQVPQLQALLDSHERSPNQELASFLRLTLDQMMSQGLHDNLEGGFYRYTVDPAWKIPHFEKMLYDNALLADLYLQAATVFNRPDYAQQAYRTLDFMLSELLDKRGAFIASLSAVDNNNIEGGYYLWSDDELAKLLSPQEHQVLQLHWGMRGAAELEAGHHAVVTLSLAETAQQMQTDVQSVKKLLASARKKLLAARQARKLPADTKLLAAWNGLALRALCHAASRPDGAKYREPARRLYDYLAGTLWNGKQLYRALGKQGALGTAGLEDYAYVAAGLYAWAQLSQQDKDLQRVKQIVQQAWQRFYTPGGWRLSERMLIAYGGEEAIIADTPMPSPSAVIVRTSLQLGKALKDEPLRQRAIQALNSGHVSLGNEPFWYATHINTLAAYQAGDL